MSRETAEEEGDERLALVAGLLELAQPGMMLRLVYSRDGERVRVAFEGADQRPGAPRLKEQLRVALESMRSRGMLFGNNELGAVRQSLGKNRSFELVPRCRGLALTPAVGFDRTAAHADRANSVIVPDIPSTRIARWLTFAPLLLLRHSALRAAEVEFTARKLAAEEIAILRAVFDEQMRKHALVFGEKSSPERSKLSSGSGSKTSGDGPCGVVSIPPLASKPQKR
ncbi:MAG TPA: hypothetical protein VJU77_16735 [Chthoniobacterales bacterium]|nr:hypothetical protein [Chthoniobacterales bacterium]